MPTHCIWLRYLSTLLRSVYSSSACPCTSSRSLLLVSEAFADPVFYPYSCGSCVYKLSGIATCSDWSQVQLSSATSFTGQVVCSTEVAQCVQPQAPSLLICLPYPGMTDVKSNPGKEAINHIYLTMYLVIPNKTCIAIFPVVPSCRRILKPWQIKTPSLLRSSREVDEPAAAGGPHTIQTLFFRGVSEALKKGQVIEMCLTQSIHSLWFQLFVWDWSLKPGELEVTQGWHPVGERCWRHG